jgi:hypothetical protein
LLVELRWLIIVLVRSVSALEVTAYAGLVPEDELFLTLERRAGDLWLETYRYLAGILE